jgi:FkbM family methyltransferase
MAHFAWLHPSAYVLGVEMDSANAHLCRQNIEKWFDRCKVVDAAIWVDDGFVRYESSSGHEDGSQLVFGDAVTGEGKLVRALAIQTLLREHGIEHVDLMKMDIEGAEKHVLKAADSWAEKVSTLIVELHGDYTGDECIGDLQRAGFIARPHRCHARSVCAERREPIGPRSQTHRRQRAITAPWHRV